MIAWALVEVLYRGGLRETRVDPVWADGSESTACAAEYRWRHDAGEVDDDGWRTKVSVRAIPPQV